MTQATRKGHQHVLNEISSAVFFSPDWTGTSAESSFNTSLALGQVWFSCQPFTGEIAQGKFVLTSSEFMSNIYSSRVFFGSTNSICANTHLNTTWLYSLNSSPYVFVAPSSTEALKDVKIAEASTSLDEDGLSEAAREDLFEIAALLSHESETSAELAFADEFREFILTYRAVGVRVFERFCLSEGSSVTIVAEGLRELGRMIDSNTHESRMQLLRKCLTHPSPIIRDAAGLGLSLLGDKRAIPSLERAVSAEKRPLLQNDS